MAAAAAGEPVRTGHQVTRPRSAPKNPEVGGLGGSAILCGSRRPTQSPPDPLGMLDGRGQRKGGKGREGASGGGTGQAGDANLQPDGGSHGGGAGP